MSDLDHDLDYPRAPVRHGEQEDPELLERDRLIAAAVKSERDACVALLEQLAATYRARGGPHHGVHEAAGLEAGVAAIRARSKP